MPVAKMAEIRETRFGCPLLEVWGMTELAGLSSTTHLLYGWNPHGSIGLPVAVHLEGCRIADFDARRGRRSARVRGGS